MNNTSFIGLFVMALIVAGLLIYWYQSRKYFYMNTYYLKLGDNNLMLKLRTSGYYTANSTMVNPNPKAPAQFSIEEGKYRLKDKQITLLPEKQLIADFRNAKALSMNAPKKVDEADSGKIEQTKFDVKNKQLYLNGQRLLKMRRAKVTTIARYKYLITPKGQNIKGKRKKETKHR